MEKIIGNLIEIKENTHAYKSEIRQERKPEDS